MNKKLLILQFVNLFLFFSFVTSYSYASDLKLEITASTLRNSGLCYLKVDYQIGSATDITLKPLTYGMKPGYDWMGGESFVFELNNTLHFCADEKGEVCPRELGYWRYNITNYRKLGTDPRYDTDYIKLEPFHDSSSGKKFDRKLLIFTPNVWYFRFCLVNVKNEGYVVSNLFSFQLNADYEICDAKNITWSEMPKVAQKSLEELIIKKAEELKETFTPEMIINQINQW